MSSGNASFWFEACMSARNKPLQAQFDAIYSSCYATVAAYCASALVAAAMFYRWRRMPAPRRLRVWRFYGWLCALTAFGSCVGLLSWISKMQQLVSLLTASNLIVQRAFQELELHYAEAARLQATFSVAYAVEFLCLSAAKLLVLDRMSDFAIANNANDIGMKRWTACGKVAISVVVTCNIVGVAANLAAAAIFSRSAESYLSAQSFRVAGNDVARRGMVTQAQSQSDDAHTASSVQSFCEVAALLLIVAAFAVVGFMCLRRLSTAMRAMRDSHANATEGHQLHRQILTTTIFVFFTFLLRSVFAIMNALASNLTDLKNPCPGNTLGLCNPDCYNMWSHMLRWMERTPEFELSVVFIASPLTLLVALWGMTSTTVLRLMRKADSTAEQSMVNVSLIPQSKPTR